MTTAQHDALTENGLDSHGIRSQITSAGRLELSLERETLTPPKGDEIVVEVEAAPINPSDLWLMLGPAELTTLEAGGTADAPTLGAAVPRERLGQLRSRLDVRLRLGTEGAGTVVRTGPAAEHMLGRRVALTGGGTWSELRKVSAPNYALLPEDVSAQEGAATYVNPMTALAMVDVCHREGHRALLHTAAASNLGQMLNRVCVADGIDLVNIVRSDEQAARLRALGASFVVNSSADDFRPQLTDAIARTGATLAFDAVGGGALANTMLQAMERVAIRAETSYSAYGSQQLKQVYIYGGLDRSPTTVTRAYGMAWSVGGFLLPWYLERIGSEATAMLRDRVLREIRTTFASSYTATISMAEALRPEVLSVYGQRATGGKYLIDPRRG